MSGFATANEIPTQGPTSNRKFQGRVVDNLDPLLKQRLKVEILNFMEGPPDLLPWVGPLVQSKFGMTETAVSVNVPVIDSIVEVEFQDGDLHYGVMTGSLHTELSAELGPLEVNYPNRRGWLDPKANWSYIDITGGQVEFQLHHYSGTQYTTYDDGQVHHLAVALYHIEAPDIKETAYATHIIEAGTSITHKAGTDFTADATSNATMKAGAVAKVTSSTKTEITSLTYVLIEAGRVDINP